MKKYFRLPSPAMLVALTALFLSLAGTSYAVKQINGKTIKNKTITGKKLKNNTLTGSQIKESKLGKVASSSQADNAALLEGTPAASFARTANFVRVLASANVGDPDITLVTNGDISVKFRCHNGAGSDRISIYASTATNGALLNSEEDDQDVLDTTTAFDSSEIVRDSIAENTFDAEDGYDDTGFVMNAASDKLITLLEGSKSVVFNRGGKDCTVGAVFIVS